MNVQDTKAIKRFLWADQCWKGAEKLCNYALHIPGLSSDPDLSFSIGAGIAVSYARPFMSAQGVGSLPQKYEEFESHFFQTNHQRLLDARNKTFGHKDELEESEDIKEIVRYALKIGHDRRLTSKILGRALEHSIYILSLIELQRSRIRDDIAGLVEKHVSLKDWGGPVEYSIHEEAPYIRKTSSGANSQSGYIRLHEISDYLEQTYSADCVIIQNGAFYEAYNTSAQYLNTNFDYSLYNSLNKDQSGQAMLKAGFPIEFGYEHLKIGSDRLIVVGQTAESGNRGTLVREIIDAMNISSEIIGQKFNEKGGVTKTTPSMRIEPEASSTATPAISEPDEYLDTYQVTAYYYKQGLAVREIAKERGQSAMTTEKHFHVCAQRKLLTVTDVFPDEGKYLKIKELISIHPEWRAKRLLEELDDDSVNYYQIYFTMGKMEIPL